jgi:hypothetical protein
VNVVHGGGGAVGERLVRHPDVPVITLTGSRETGIAVLKSAADNLKHVHLELGGKNAIIVLDDAGSDPPDGIAGRRDVRTTLHRGEPRDHARRRLRRAAVGRHRT